MSELSHLQGSKAPRTSVAAISWRRLILLGLTLAAAVSPGFAATNRVPLDARTHLLRNSAWFSEAKTTVVTNRTPGRFQLFITNAHAPDFTVMVRDNGTYHVVNDSLKSHADALEVSVPVGTPYILKSNQPTRAVLSTKPVFLAGAVGMDQIPTNGISISLINDWRSYDARSGSYTSQLQLCFIAPDTADVRRFLPLTVQLQPSDGVSIPNHTVVLTDIGYGSCKETSIICRGGSGNQVVARSNIGDAVLSISFSAGPILYRILPAPVFWTTIVCSLLGSLVRLIASDHKKKTPWWLLLQLLVGIIAGLFLVGALWAGIGLGNLTEAALGKLAGVAAVAMIGGYGGSAIFEWALKKWFPGD